MLAVISICVIVALYHFVKVLIGRREEKRLLNLTGKRILITGAATGLGEATAYEYAKHGSKLVITDINSQNLTAVKDRCLKLGALNVEVFSADLSQHIDQMALIKFVNQCYKGLEQLILIHAAPSRFAPWKSTTKDLEYLTSILNVNFLSYVELASAASKTLMNNGGNIGVVSSLAGRIPLKNLSSYCATKHALQGFFSTWSNELSDEKSKLSITICAFGLIATPSALSDIKRGYLLRSPKSAISPKNAAGKILRSVSLKEREIVYPLEPKICLQLYKIIPQCVVNVVGSYVSAKPNFGTPLSNNSPISNNSRPLINSRLSINSRVLNKSHNVI